MLFLRFFIFDIFITPSFSRCPSRHAFIIFIFFCFSLLRAITRARQRYAADIFAIIDDIRAIIDMRARAMLMLLCHTYMPCHAMPCYIITYDILLRYYYMLPAPAE